VVAAASYEARAFGIHSAMPCAQAARRCPDAVFVRPRFAAYKEASAEIHRVFRLYTDRVEPLSLDEAYLDVTVNHPNITYASTIAREIRERIRREVRLTASAGVGPNKFIAKLASDVRKPDGLLVVQPHEVLDFISPLPVERLWGVGPATAGKLHGMGLRTIGEVARCSRVALERRLGSMGNFLRELAHGRDTREVQARRRPRSRGAETTFSENLLDVEALREVLRNLAVRVAGSLARVDRPARTVTLKVRYASFDTVTRSRTLTVPTADAEEIADLACQLLTKTQAGQEPVRLLGISASNLFAPGEGGQLELPLSFDGAPTLSTD
jgi:DNA polymerase-4